eukprot:3044_1
MLMDKLHYRSQNLNIQGGMIEMEHELRKRMNTSQLITFYMKVIVSFETSKSFWIRGGIGKYGQFTANEDLNPQFMHSNRSELQKVTNCNDYSEGDVMRYKSINRQMAKQAHNSTVSGVTCFRYNETYQSFLQDQEEDPSQYERSCQTVFGDKSLNQILREQHQQQKDYLKEIHEQEIKRIAIEQKKLENKQKRQLKLANITLYQSMDCFRTAVYLQYITVYLPI